jgi:hypothetical protein
MMKEYEYTSIIPQQLIKYTTTVLQLDVAPGSSSATDRPTKQTKGACTVGTNGSNLRMLLCWYTVGRTPFTLLFNTIHPFPPWT